MRSFIKQKQSLLIALCCQQKKFLLHFQIKCGQLALPVGFVFIMNEYLVEGSHAIDTALPIFDFS